MPRVLRRSGSYAERYESAWAKPGNIIAGWEFPVNQQSAIGNRIGANNDIETIEQEICRWAESAPTEATYAHQGMTCNNKARTHQRTNRMRRYVIQDAEAAEGQYSEAQRVPTFS